MELAPELDLGAEGAGEGEGDPESVLLDLRRQMLRQWGLESK